MSSLRNDEPSSKLKAGAPMKIKSSNDKNTGISNPNIKSLIPNKKHLSKAIESYYKGTTAVDFAWEKQIEANKFGFTAFEVEELGEIKIPLSSEVAFAFLLMIYSFLKLTLFKLY